MKKLVFLGFFSVLLLNLSISYGQETDLENLEKKLHIYKKDFTNPLTSPQQLDAIIQGYQDLLINSTPIIKLQTPRGQSTFESVNAWFEQYTILQSLQETIEGLQAQELHNRIKKILDEVIVPKLNQTAKVCDTDSSPDLQSYKETIYILGGILNYKDPKDSTKNISIPQYYEAEFKKWNASHISLNDKTQDIEHLLNESIDALNRDFLGNLSTATVKLDRVVKIFKIILLRIIPFEELVFRTSDSIKIPEERLAAIQTLINIMGFDQTISVDEDTKRAILVFIEGYQKKLTEKQQKECKNISDYLATYVSSRKRSFSPQTLDNIKQLSNQIKAEFDDALASEKLSKEQAELCEKGKLACEAVYSAAVWAAKQ
ncbi:MAG: hypothetical protein HYW85_05650 [Deltaproteobacteria bacterium]|nr:hypothetical protein [Deltaproteobacteria bacterium]